MDRNSIIAILLILLIWVLWPKWAEFIGGRPQKTPPAAVTAPVDTTGRATTPARRATAPAPGVAAAESLRSETLVAAETTPVREITVETSQYTAVLSNRGALLEQVTLGGYRTSAGAPVELLPPGGYGMGLLVGEPGHEIDLTQRVFQATSAASRYVVGGRDSAVVDFDYTLPNGNRVYKRFTFRGASYTVGFAAGFADLGHSDRLAFSWYGAVPAAEGDVSHSLPFMKVESFVGGGLETVQFSGKAATKNFTGRADWVGIRSKYFLVAFAPSYGDPSEVRLVSMGVKNAAVTYSWQIAPANIARSEVSGLLYVGPIDVDLLTQAGHNLDRAADLGWTIIRPISKLVLWTFLSMHRIVPNYGVIVIVFSVLIKIILHPLTKKSYESTTKMQKLKPLMDELRAKYKADQQRLNQEMIKLYKEQGFNPLGGCLPMILQMPIIFAIYAVLSNNIEFRQAPFMLWIHDLSRPDTVYQLPFSLPLYGRGVNILPILMAVAMFFQQKLTITDPKQKMMVYIMPVMMLFIFNNLSSGLVLYWFMFNALSSAHQYWLMRPQHEPATAVARAAHPANPAPMKSPMKRRRR